VRQELCKILCKFSASINGNYGSEDSVIPLRLALHRTVDTRACVRAPTASIWAFVTRPGAFGSSRLFTADGNQRAAMDDNALPESAIEAYLIDENLCYNPAISKQLMLDKNDCLPHCIATSIQFGFSMIKSFSQVRVEMPSIVIIVAVVATSGTVR
jgi:hypothetical protein